ncbi:YicC family protein [Marixanthomonas sp. SCSIO 43207]|uniref:YicC/YloC family endoribonuclease n=1 Tax=Marixanthomonas sp. SCSIO 43207 TaxID=2779360 RepID=UPI001CA90197|nr:YicC/YloC family endoribonuclease [Marixanthomonas sp. SCSIO 43207]UAB82057.1 YicC family protein [Marixanthomonas sp. SCSIO 43207]
MIQSMTGYGKSLVQLPSKKITVEIKSLNSKNLDVNARVPSAYREKELDIRKRISKSLSRGKVDFNLYVELTGEETNTVINEAAVKQYMKQLAHITDGNPVELMKMAVRFPDALQTERDEIDETEYNKIIEAVDEALRSINQYRTDEGKALEADFQKRINNISALLEEVMKLDPQRMDNVKERLTKAVSDLKETVDENRFEQELMYYLEKYDITEEKVRLQNHLEYFSETLQSKTSNGKKLGFISQEIGREINTIGSKANFAPMQQVVVQMKDELEKIKEQALNVL